jgi:hypothetical protein
MKWFNKTAQGFSPVSCRDKPRPERAAESEGYVISGSVAVERTTSKLSFPGFVPSASRYGAIGNKAGARRSPLQGDLAVDSFPGLKHLGYSVRPFHGQKTSRRITS